MRIAALVLGLLLSALSFFQSLAISALVGKDNDMAGPAGAGMIAAMIGAAGAALVIGFPLASVVLFVLASLLGLMAGAGGFSDQYIYAVVFAVLAVMAFFGWRGKLRDKKAAAVERQRQIDRDDRLEQLLRQSQSASSHEASVSVD